MRKIAPLLVLAVLSCTSAAQAAAPRKMPAKAPIEAKIPFATTALDPTADTLPHGYLGHSCRGFAKKALSLNAKKGEFETSSAYSERIVGLSDTAMIGSTKLSDVVGFVENSPFLVEKYDADREVLSIRGYWGSVVQLVGEKIFLSAMVDSEPVSSRTYAASNAYGKTVQVKSITSDVCGLAFLNLPYLSPKKKNIEVALSLPPDEAKEAKGSITVMYVGKLVAPFTMHYVNRSEPKIDSPTEAIWSGDGLVMELSQIWLFNKSTGRIYQKIDI